MCASMPPATAATLSASFLAIVPTPKIKRSTPGIRCRKSCRCGDRFGLTLTFAPFSQADYMATVEHLAQRLGLSQPLDTLRRQALIWAQQQNGFSGRTARQFLQALQAGLVEVG
jgi:hypothetical protein